MFVNAKKVGHAYLPLKRPGENPASGFKGQWLISKALGSVTTQNVMGYDVVQTPPILMVGCHRNTDDTIFRDFGLNNSTYDELAIWTRKLVTNQTLDEAVLFNGGYGTNR